MSAIYLRPGEQLGRYRILSPLAHGGMADVWLAEAAGASGFRKRIVLKTILPRFAEDPEFVAMFINEAIVASGLNHPNIVQIFDLGELDGHYFIAMEHVPGRTVRQVMKAAKKREERVPRWFALHVVSSACEGLHYAHDYCDEGGRPLGLVHRDMSPENLMVSFAGNVKVLDFGVAKVTSNDQGTKAGVLKGKHAYIAPEMFDGQIDRRIDVYALGVILYELLTGRRPYGGKTLLDVAWQLKFEPAPAPRTLNPSIPEDLEAIMMEALERDPAKRFPDAASLQKSIDQFLVGSGGRPSPSAVGAYLMSLFPEDAPQPSVSRPSPSERNPSIGKSEEESLPVILEERGWNGVESPAPSQPESPPPEKSGRRLTTSGGGTMGSVFHTFASKSDRLTPRSKWPGTPTPARASSPSPPPPESVIPETAKTNIVGDNPIEEATRRFDHGLRLLRAGQEKEALKEWERAAELDPANRDYEFNIKRLRKRMSSERAS